MNSIPKENELLDGGGSPSPRQTATEDYKIPSSGISSASTTFEHIECGTPSPASHPHQPLNEEGGGKSITLTMKDKERLEEYSRLAELLDPGNRGYIPCDSVHLAIFVIGFEPTKKEMENVKAELDEIRVGVTRNRICGKENDKHRYIHLTKMFKNYDVPVTKLLPNLTKNLRTTTRIVFLRDRTPSYCDRNMHTNC